MTRNKYDLEGKVAIVTGGSRGIGRAIALGLAEAGADVVVAGRKLEDLEVAAREIAALGRRSLPVATHMSESDDINNLADKTVSEFGRIDILVNNAASAFGGSLLKDEKRTWDHLIDVNMRGPFLLGQAVARIMVQQNGGSIINVASIHALKPDPKLSIYSVSKAGIVMLTRVMAKEWGRYNIRVNAIGPGWVKTRMSESVWSDPEALKGLESQIPLGRMAEPEEMVGPVLFLASEDSSYVTGQTIFLDGGITI